MILYFDDSCPFCTKIVKKYKKYFKKVIWIGLSKTSLDKRFMYVFEKRLYQAEDAFLIVLKNATGLMSLLKYVPGMAFFYKFLSNKRWFLSKFL